MIGHCGQIASLTRLVEEEVPGAGSHPDFELGVARLVAGESEAHLRHALLDRLPLTSEGAIVRLVVVLQMRAESQREPLRAVEGAVGVLEEDEAPELVTWVGRGVGGKWTSVRPDMQFQKRYKRHLRHLLAVSPEPSRAISWAARRREHRVRWVSPRRVWQKQPQHRPGSTRCATPSECCTGRAAP